MFVMAIESTHSEPPLALQLVPPFPEVAQQIITMVNREDSAMSDIGALVKRDPLFSAELLRFANSAMFRVRQEVRSIPHALMLVGAERVKAMAVLVVMHRLVQSALKIDSLRKVWIHSLATALIAEQTAKAFRVSKDIGYTIGLLHNLGALALMSSFPDRYNTMLTEPHSADFDLLQIERDRFGIDHCQAGAYLAGIWNFPDLLVGAIEDHHAEPVPDQRSAANMVRVGWRMADSLGFAAFPRAREWRFDETMSILPDAASGWLREDAETVAVELHQRLAEAPI